jgi:hypothetical protein
MTGYRPKAVEAACKDDDGSSPMAVVPGLRLIALEVVTGGGMALRGQTFARQ